MWWVHSDTTWKRIERSGLRMVFLGAESGSDETLKRMNKGGSASTDKTLQMAEKARRYYELERLWKSAKRLEPADLKTPARRAAKKPAVQRNNGLVYVREFAHQDFGGIEIKP